MISLLAINGLRISEALGADIDKLGIERGHRTLPVLRKGGKIVTIPLAPRGKGSRADAEICRRLSRNNFRICLMSGYRFSVIVMLLAGRALSTLSGLRAVRVIPCGARSRQTGRSCPPRWFVVLRRDVPGPAVEA